MLQFFLHNYFKHFKLASQFINKKYQKCDHFGKGILQNNLFSYCLLCCIRYYDSQSQILNAGKPLWKTKRHLNVLSKASFF